MRQPRHLPFVAPATYRRRRLIDAARLLPFLGVLLIALPTLWSPDTNPETAVVREGVYLFLVWLGLILGAWAFSRALRPVVEQEAEDSGSG